MVRPSDVAFSGSLRGRKDLGSALGFPGGPEHSSAFLPSLCYRAGSGVSEGALEISRNCGFSNSITLQLIDPCSYKCVPCAVATRMYSLVENMGCNLSIVDAQVF